MWSWFKNKTMDAPIQPMRRYTAAAAKQKQGAQAEQQARIYLQHSGLKLIDANVACMQGEIDLIMLDQKTLVFVEVRWRKTQQFGGAIASITPRKLHKLHTACEMFLQHNPKWRASSCRIDAVLLQGELSQPTIIWLKNITG